MNSESKKEGSLEISYPYVSIAHYIELGYEAAEKNDTDSLKQNFLSAWSLLKREIGKTNIHNIQNLVRKDDDARITIQNWLWNFDTELMNASEYETARTLAGEMLEIVELDSHAEGNIKRCYADTFSLTGDTIKADELYGKWITEKPLDGNLRFGWALTLEDRKEYEKAAEVLEDAISNEEVDFRFELYDAAERIFDKLGDQAKSIFYRRKAREESEKQNQLKWYKEMPIAEPIIKDKKIYPNDLCPCGSGKKYKKCCGRNR